MEGAVKNSLIYSLWYVDSIWIKMFSFVDNRDGNSFLPETKEDVIMFDACLPGSIRPKDTEK